MVCNVVSTCAKHQWPRANLIVSFTHSTCEWLWCMQLSSSHSDPRGETANDPRRWVRRCTAAFTCDNAAQWYTAAASLSPVESYNGMLQSIIVFIIIPSLRTRAAACSKKRTRCRSTAVVVCAAMCLCSYLNLRSHSNNPRMSENLTCKIEKTDPHLSIPLISEAMVTISCGW